MAATRKRWQDWNFSPITLCVDSTPDPRALVEEVSVTPGSPTSLLGCGYKCLRGGLGRPGRPECHGQGLDREGKAQPAGERSSRPSKEMSRAGRETWCAVRSVAGGLLWKPNQHLQSALQAAGLRSTSGKAAHYVTHRYHLGYLVRRAPAGLPQEPLRLPGESQCLFQSHIKMTEHHNAFSSSGFKQRELLSFHCN